MAIVTVQKGKCIVEGNMKAAILDSGNGNFIGMPATIRIGDTWYKRCSGKDLTGNEVLYAGHLSMEFIEA